MKVSNDTKVHGRSVGRFNGLNLKSELFIGGFENYDRLRQQTRHEKGFAGCISELTVNDEKKDFGKWIFLLYIQ